MVEAEAAGEGQGTEGGVKISPSDGMMNPVRRRRDETRENCPTLPSLSMKRIIISGIVAVSFYSSYLFFILFIAIQRRNDRGPST